MLAGRYRCPPILYVAIAVLLVALVLIGAWSKYHVHGTPVTPPLHEQK